jgi:hypothetical protein
MPSLLAYVAPPPRPPRRPVKAGELAVEDTVTMILLPDRSRGAPVANAAADAGGSAVIAEGSPSGAGAGSGAGATGAVAGSGPSGGASSGPGGAGGAASASVSAASAVLSAVTSSRVHAPVSCLWWRTFHGQDFFLVGTLTGSLLFVDVRRRSEQVVRVAEAHVPVVRLELLRCVPGLGLAWPHYLALGCRAARFPSP